MPTNNGPMCVEGRIYPSRGRENVDALYARIALRELRGVLIPSQSMEGQVRRDKAVAYGTEILRQTRGDEFVDQFTHHP